MDPSFHLTEGCWEEYRQALTIVRYQVFVDEQGIPESLELDGTDAHCHHVLVTDSGRKPVGAGRISPDGHIGRMAVVKDCRGLGIGTAMLDALLDYAREQGHVGVFLHAQFTAVRFYESLGFVPGANVFLDAGIPHRRMVMSL